MPSLATRPTLSRRSAVRLGSGGLAAALATKGFRPAQAEDSSMLEANKAIVRRVFEEAINAGDVAVVTEVYDPDYVDRGAWARQMPGPAGMPLTIAEFRALYPDVTVTVDAVIAEGDLVATRETWRGIHPPAGPHVVGRTMHLFRLADGRIVEQWSAGWDWPAELGRGPEMQLVNPLAGA